MTTQATQLWEKAALKNIEIGSAVVPWDPKLQGWILPSCSLEKDRRKAEIAACKINELIQRFS